MGTIRTKDLKVGMVVVEDRTGREMIVVVKPEPRSRYYSNDPHWMVSFRFDGGKGARINYTISPSQVWHLAA